MFPALHDFGGFVIYSYGVSVALAFVAAFAWVGWKSAREGVSVKEAYDLLFIFFLTGVAGARFFYVLQHPAEFAGNWFSVFNLRTGGLVWYGGFFAAACSGLVYARKLRWPILKLCDFFSPPMAIGHAIGRVGCFLNACCYGRTTEGFGVVFPGDQHARIPVQLYEAAALALLAIGLEIWSHRKKTDGSVFVGYLLLYPLARFGLEFLRADQATTAGLTVPQWTSLILFAGAVFLAVRLRSGKGRDGKV